MARDLCQAKISVQNRASELRGREPISKRASERMHAEEGKLGSVPLTRGLVGRPRVVVGC